jgi:hypothetical protein
MLLNNTGKMDEIFLMYKESYTNLSEQDIVVPFSALQTYSGTLDCECFARRAKIFTKF